MGNKGIDLRALTAGVVHSVYEKLLCIRYNKPLLQKYCRFLYNLYQENVKTICLVSGYEYIPNARLNLNDKNKFNVNIVNLVNTTFTDHYGYNLSEIDREITDYISESLIDNPVYYQPIWAEYITETDSYHIFDGTHRFLALLARYNEQLYMPETLMVTLNRTKLSEKSTKIYVPDYIYEIIDDLLETCKFDYPDDESYTILHSFSYCGTKIYAMNMSYYMLKKVIVAWTMIINLLYKWQKNNQFDLEPAVMVHKNIFKKD